MNSFRNRLTSCLSFTTFLFLALLLLAPGCSKKETGVIKIGAIIPLSGPFAAYGEPVRDGMFLAVELINAEGGINGRKIEIILEDDGGDPKTSVNAFTKLATVSKVPIVIGPLSSGASMATAPLADRYGVVQLSTLAGTIDLSKAGDFVFRIYPSSEVGSHYIANVAVERFQAKSVAILYPNNSFGVTSNKFISEVMSEAGIDIVTVETYNDGDRDFRTQLAKIKRANPDLLLCSAYYEDGAQILVQAQQLGLSIPVLGEDGWFGPIANMVGAGIENLYFANAAFGSEYTNNPIMQKFIKKYEEQFNKKANSYAGAGYAGVEIVKHCIEIAGLDGTEIKQTLYALDLLTAFGQIKFDENGDNVGAVYDLFQLNELNEPVLVK